MNEAIKTLIDARKPAQDIAAFDTYETMPDDALRAKIATMEQRAAATDNEESAALYLFFADRARGVIRHRAATSEGK